jgi:hypothetical protein
VFSYIITVNFCPLRAGSSRRVDKISLWENTWMCVHYHTWLWRSEPTLGRRELCTDFFFFEKSKGQRRLWRCSVRWESDNKITVIVMGCFVSFRFVSFRFVVITSSAYSQWASRLFLFSLDHTQTHTTVGRTPLDEGSARRRDLYQTTQTLTKDKHPCPRWDSNPRSQQALGRRLTL